MATQEMRAAFLDRECASDDALRQIAAARDFIRALRLLERFMPEQLASAVEYAMQIATTFTPSFRWDQYLQLLVPRYRDSLTIIPQTDVCEGLAGQDRLENIRCQRSYTPRGQD